MRTVIPLLVLCGALPSCAEQAGDTSYLSTPSGTTTTTVWNESTASENRPNGPTAGRQIIYRASLSLRVEDFAAAENGIKSAIEAAGGYLGQFRQDRSRGKQRSGYWSVRVPVASFENFLEAVAKLGVTEDRQVQSQDVTEEYVDLSSRKKNKETLETRLLELVNARGEIKDVLALETELSRVREEIEKIEGRLRLIADRVAMTTVEITAYEPVHFQAADVKFSSRVANAFRMSIDNLRRFCEGLLIVLTVLAPWLVLLAAVVTPLVWIFRRRRKRAASPPVTATLS